MHKGYVLILMYSNGVYDIATKNLSQFYIKEALVPYLIRLEFDEKI